MHIAWNSCGNVALRMVDTIVQQDQNFLSTFFVGISRKKHYKGPHTNPKTHTHTNTHTHTHTHGEISFFYCTHTHTHSRTPKPSLLRGSSRGADCLHSNCLLVDWGVLSSISPTFYDQLLFRKFSYKKASSKMLVKLTTVDLGILSSISPKFGEQLFSAKFSDKKFNLKMWEREEKNCKYSEIRLK